jgi:hypothetical protein
LNSSKRRTGELSPWSRVGGAGGSKFAVIGGAPVAGVGQEVEGGSGELVRPGTS